MSLAEQELQKEIDALNAKLAELTAQAKALDEKANSVVQGTRQVRLFAPGCRMIDSSVHDRNHVC